MWQWACMAVVFVRLRIGLIIGILGSVLGLVCKRLDLGLRKKPIVEYFRNLSVLLVLHPEEDDHSDDERDKRNPTNCAAYDRTDRSGTRGWSGTVSEPNLIWLSRIRICNLENPEPTSDQ